MLLLGVGNLYSKVVLYFISASLLPRKCDKNEMFEDDAVGMYIYAINATFSAYLCNAVPVSRYEKHSLRNDFSARNNLENSRFR